jgi:hypothetical protein
VAASPDLSDAPARRITVGRVVIVAVLLALALMWIYALSGAAKEDPPDQLDDPSFPEAAEARCADAVAVIDDLPPAQDVATPEERAPIVATATDGLDAMVDDLEAEAESLEGRDAEITAEWIADWRTYLEDRRDHEAELEGGSTEPFEVTPRGNRQITVTMDNFATVNDMESCATPLDL